MTFSGLMLRCLLSLALISNGLAGAMNMSEVRARQDAVAIEHSPCHSAHAAMGMPQPAKSAGESIPDCCKDGRCQCACSLQTPVVAISSAVNAKLNFVPTPAIATTEPVRTVFYTPLLRPPIA
jgi:hypothetical protein